MKYDQFEFLEFFDDEIISHDQGVNLEVHYILKLNLLKIILILKPSSNYAAVLVEHIDLKYSLLKIGFDNIVNVSCDKEFLYFYKEDKNLFPYKDSTLNIPFFRVRIRPNFYCTFDITRTGIAQNDG